MNTTYENLIELRDQLVARLQRTADRTKKNGWLEALNSVDRSLAAVENAIIAHEDGRMFAVEIYLEDVAPNLRSTAFYTARRSSQTFAAVQVSI